MQDSALRVGRKPLKQSGYVLKGLHFHKQSVHCLSNPRASLVTCHAITLLVHVCSSLVMFQDHVWGSGLHVTRDGLWSHFSPACSNLWLGLLGNNTDCCCSLNAYSVPGTTWGLWRPDLIWGLILPPNTYTILDNLLNVSLIHWLLDSGCPRGGNGRTSRRLLFHSGPFLIPLRLVIRQCSWQLRGQGSWGNRATMKDKSGW
jgi:hypothetical protein